MQITSTALHAGLSGFQAGQQKVEQAAVEVARSASAGDQATAAPALSEALVEMRIGQHQAEVSGKVIKTADEVLGTLLDTRA
ncbi:hypothetical protein [Stutzerimonas tarimensis]|uniref:Flagellar biosynthesis protein FlgE n=1 Tax=Stutzerimonas tarimensis TaxID=1507735 RepID=A0ABV7T539_9GAMM